MGLWDEKTCLNGGPHKFQPRYDIKAPEWMTRLISFKNLEVDYEEIYVCDVCVWCGKVVKREGEHE